ncbi:Translational activator of cytochrome c oxidase 1, partial [Megadyptes antipodes antipodes]
EGGPDPALNAQLANVVEQCRAKNMPKASIEAAIHGAVGPGGFWAGGGTTRLRAEGGGARGATGPSGPARLAGGGAGGGAGGRGPGRLPG